MGLNVGLDMNESEVDDKIEDELQNVLGDDNEDGESDESETAKNKPKIKRIESAESTEKTTPNDADVTNGNPYAFLPSKQVAHS